MGPVGGWVGGPGGREYSVHAVNECVTSSHESVTSHEPRATWWMVDGGWWWRKKADEFGALQCCGLLCSCAVCCAVLQFVVQCLFFCATVRLCDCATVRLRDCTMTIRLLDASRVRVLCGVARSVGVACFAPWLACRLASVTLSMCLGASVPQCLGASVRPRSSLLVLTPRWSGQLGHACGTEWLSLQRNYALDMPPLACGQTLALRNAPARGP